VRARPGLALALEVGHPCEGTIPQRFDPFGCTASGAVSVPANSTIVIADTTNGIPAFSTSARFGFRLTNH
jgi:hypothetical protein